VLGEVGVDEAVDGIFAAIDDGWQGDGAGFERGFVGGGFEGEAGLPGEAFGDPLFEEVGFGGGEAGAFGGHAEVFVGGGDDIEQEAFFGFAGFDDGAVFAAVEEGGAVVHGEAAFEFVAGVAFTAVFAEEGDDLVIEVNACVESGGGGGEEEEAGGELHPE
jgi:hypothetical protein